MNEIDLENVSQLDAESNKGGLNSGDAIAHEAVEAFLTLSKELTAAHDEVSRLFPGLGFPKNNYNHVTKDSDGFREIPFSRFSQDISDGRGSMQVTVTYDTPIPAHAIDPVVVRDPERRQKEVEVAGPRVTKVQFIPKSATP